MALTVVVRSGELEDQPELTFDSPRVVIGRGSSCEIRLPDSSVSLRHASFRQRGGDYIVLDEGSTNGTFVGPVRLSAGAPRMIRNGDMIRCGRVWLEVRLGAAIPTQDAAQATKDIALNLMRGSLEAHGEPTAVILRVESGPDAGAEFNLDSFQKPFVVGRSNEVAVPLSDHDVSRRHLELRRRGEGIAVCELGSKNGAFLDEQTLPANRMVTWKRGQVLRLGQTVLSYEDPLSEALEELERAGDEELSSDETIAMPATSSTGQGAASVPVPSSPMPTHAGPPKSSAPAIRPRAEPVETSGGWNVSDLLVLILALATLIASAIGLMWLIRS